jgi:type I restriction enzyme S subunit
VEKMTEIELPVDWKQVKLGKVVKRFFSGGTPTSKQPEFWDGDVPWTTSAAIGDEDVSINKAQRYITAAGLANSATNLVPKGNLLVGTRVGVGKAVVNELDIAISQDLTGIAFTDDAASDFVAFFFKSQAVRVFMDGRKRGTTIKGISRFDLQEVELNLPPLPEQHAIANVLGALQAALTARRREQQLEQEYKATLLEQLFTRGTRGEATQETEIGELPVSWEATTLGNLLNIKGGKRLAKGAPFAETRTPHPYLRVTDFANGTIKVENLKYITPEVQAPIARYIIRPADVYISIAGSIGLVGVIPAELDGANLTENAARLVIKNPNHLDRDYLAKYLATEYGQQQIKGLTVKTTQPKLALARIAWIKIPLPPLLEQQRIAAVLGALDAKLEALTMEVARLEELFRALLEELLSGRLRVEKAE